MNNNKIESKAKPPKKSIYYVGKLQHVIGRQWTLPEITALADELLEWMEKDESRIWVRSFFTGKRITKQTANRMRTRSDYFANCHDLALALQEERLLARGLSGNNACVIFALKNCHAWTEKPAEAENDDEFVLIDNWGSELEINNNNMEKIDE